ncbi:ADP-ribose pyrophosphatase YjhB (NUDIX family) [Paenibacillus taihuensis]|uniref:ADP-ribose pyrophosphatase YjhB (NUDIX family) n=1 Tax=Paenibacillus taihuensis TaxID=1156355 RepID=A0A3D9SNL7_9BACL|nr:NUDIX domain-containing protein [Paenibacillus taihuensis]REE94535.1 ADP-ribose pyrophosphatase YjhB (NUDIX family) [Paenibacillus taihuensis]
MRVSVGVQAVIFQNNRVLTVKKREDDGGVSYILPGGKQEFGETIEQAIRREVFEEVGIAVKVNELLFLREFIGANHDHAEANKELHIVSPIFSCSLLNADDDIPQTPPHPDPDQIGVEWIEVSKLSEVRFYPKELVPRLIEIASGVKINPCYVGDMN